jgi:hypothetical protein
MATKFTPIPLAVLTGTETPPTKASAVRQLTELDVRNQAVSGDLFLMTDANGRAYSIEKTVLGKYMNTGVFDPNETYWTDYLTPIGTGKVPPAAAPTWTAFGPSGNIFAYAFAEGDYIFVGGFHINHDIKRGSKVYPHVHWTTDGTSTGLVEWEIEFTYCKGHNQEAFPAPTVVTVGSAASGTAWQHMISEVVTGDAFDAPEVDSIVLMRIKRNSTSPTNEDAVYGLFVDMHVQIERSGTLNKAPDFYS